MQSLDPEISIMTIGEPETGKSSLGNALLGKNEEKDENYNKSLVLFAL